MLGTMLFLFCIPNIAMAATEAAIAKPIIGSRLNCLVILGV